MPNVVAAEADNIAICDIVATAPLGAPAGLGDSAVVVVVVAAIVVVVVVVVVVVE